LETKGETWEFSAIKPTGPSITPLDEEINTLEKYRKEILKQQKKKITREEGEEDTSYVSESRKRKKEIRDSEKHALDQINTLEESSGNITKRKHRKYDNIATAEDHLILKKDEVQQYFLEDVSGDEDVSGEDIKFFNKHKRSIFNRALYTRYPKKVRHKLHSNNIEMSISDEYVNMDIKLLDCLDFIVKELGLESVTDVSHFDWVKMIKDDKIGKISSVLAAMDKMTGREHDCSGDLNRMRHYFKKVLGYNVASYVTKTRGQGTRTSYTTYFLQDVLGGILERPNTILNGDWFKNQCEKYGRIQRNRGVPNTLSVL